MKSLSPDGPGNVCREPTGSWPQCSHMKQWRVTQHMSQNKSLTKDLETNHALPHSQAATEATRHTWLWDNAYGQICALHLPHSWFRANNSNPTLSKCPDSLLPDTESSRPDVALTVLCPSPRCTLGKLDKIVKYCKFPPAYQAQWHRNDPRTVGGKEISH